VSAGDLTGNVSVISFLGNLSLICMAIMIIIDIIFLLLLHMNSRILAIANVLLSLTMFLIMEHAFLKSYFSIAYVWSYSGAGMQLLYKIVAIWAGDAGSIMTWLMLTTLFVFAYRLKNKDPSDRLFQTSVCMAQILSLILAIIIIEMNPFQIDAYYLPGGAGLNPELMTYYMVLHPLFIFIAYSIFLLPFTVIMAKSVTRDRKDLQGGYEKKFIQISMKLGWLVLTVGICIGSYWARTTLGWNGYWEWDPVETVSLVPWIFSTSYFHTNSFTGKKERLAHINVALVFISIVFSSIITRGGGIVSVHAFAGGTGLAVFAILSGALVLVLSIYIIFFIIDIIGEEYKNRKILFDDLAYFFLFSMAFICAIGVIVSPLSLLFSASVPIIPGPSFYAKTLLLPAGGLAITFVFCALLKMYSLKNIALAVIVAMGAFSGCSVVIFFVSGIFINPVVVCYALAFLATCIAIRKNIRRSMNLGQFFKANSRHLIHAGISLILVGTITTNAAIQDYVFIPGFFLLIAGMLPSLVVSFMKGMPSQEIVPPAPPTPEEIGASRGR
jgi:cytochrome c-type biogenesis protein CcmF